MSAPHSLRRALLLAIVLVATTVVSMSPSRAADEAPFGPGAIDGPPRTERVHQDFFGLGMDINPYNPTSWPDFGLGAVRISAGWLWLERTPGVYTWWAMDIRVATAEARGAKPLLVLHGTPGFHAAGSGAPSSASAPDLTAYRRFVRALVTRYGDRVDYQVWNEPNVPMFFTGDVDHVAEMTLIMSKAVRRLAPEATVVAPSFPVRGEVNSSRIWFKRYWRREVEGRPVRRLVDVASVSAYPMPDGDPEDGLAITQWTRNTLTKIGFEGPLWITEINYGGNSGLPTKTIPMRREVANVVRTLALQATTGADRVYWFHWTPNVTMNTQLQDGQGVLTPAGSAYGVAEDWILDTRPLGCQTVRGVSTCGFRAHGGVKRYVSWNRYGRTRTMLAPSGARSITTPAGVSTRVSPGDRIRVGLTPVMIEVRPTR